MTYGTVASPALLIDQLFRVGHEAPRLRAAGLILAGMALMTVAAKTQVPMWPVPMTMQTLAALVIGMAYGGRLGGATVTAYLAAGFAGLPVFAGPAAGPAYFLGPTAGYLVGFAVAAWLVGSLADRGWSRSVVRTFVANILGTAVIFALGILWLTGFIAASGQPAGTAVLSALGSGLTPFLLGALVKCLLAAVLLPLLWRAASR